MFSRTPVDVIKGLRKGRMERSAFLTTVFSEIRQEIKSPDLAVKTNALQKLFVLSLEQYELDWAGFNILEIMSSHKFSQKRTGYLIGSLALPGLTDVLFLATNLFRHDFVSTNYLEANLAVSCLANVIDGDLARELINDCLPLLSANKPVLRKKACALFFKIFYVYPDGMQQGFERLSDNLKDENQSVVVSTVNTLLETARYNPRYVLLTAKELYELLLRTSNNWMIIKLIKLFTYLISVEPRLVKRLTEPFGKLLSQSSAKSVEFEVIRAVFIAFREVQALVDLALVKLQTFLDSNDPNLKYLGLLVYKLCLNVGVQVPNEFRAFVLESLQSKDITIRLQALEILQLTTTQETVIDIIQQLSQELTKPESSDIKEDVIRTILAIICKDHYDLIEDFDWVFKILCALAQVKTTENEIQLSGIMLDVVLRVEQLRPEACEICLEILENFESVKSERCECLAAMIFILGEYGHTVQDEGARRSLEVLNKPRWWQVQLPEIIYNALTSACFKLILRDSDGELSQTVHKMLLERAGEIDRMEPQERCLLYTNLLSKLDASQSIEFIGQLPQLLPVHPSAQSLIPPPEILQSPQQINEAELYLRKEDGSIEYLYFKDEDFMSADSFAQESIKSMKQQLSQAQQNFILPKRKKGKKKKKKGKMENMEEVKEERKAEITLPVPKSEKKYKVNKETMMMPPPPQ